MIVGVDFDNTIVCYDQIFHRVAQERELIPVELPVNKTAVRDHLRQVGQEPIWTEIQGYVYGPRLKDAVRYAGVKAFFIHCREQGITVKIVSHKTRHPYAGEAHDLHAAARGWLEQQGFFDPEDVALPRDAVFLELTKEAKLNRIATLNCDVFIDDLPEILMDPGFPAGVRRILFDPHGQRGTGTGLKQKVSWAEVSELIPTWTAADAAESITAAASRLLALAGLTAGTPPQRMTGGGNNRVYCVRTAEGSRYLLKQYFASQPGQHNRFEAERAFYRLTAVTAPEMTPRALAWDANTRLALLEFVEGERLLAGEIGPTEMAAALEFFSRLNRGRNLPQARALANAAEACFSLEQHCCSVDRRLRRLKEIPTVSPLDQAAMNFVFEELVPAWQVVRERVLAVDSVDKLPAAERCVSPSDFGFHNGLRRADGSLVFLDFEYSGWDDPAKTMCDFFCQPAVPAPTARFESFLAAAGESLGLRNPEHFIDRTRRLLPLYRLKWCAIMLNEFVRADRSRRDFALGRDVSENRKTLQLSAARRLLGADLCSLHETTT